MKQRLTPHRPGIRLALAAFACLASLASAALTSPKEHFGFAIGDDYHLANYTQTEAYFKKLAAESDRLRLVDIGRTEEGRTQWMMIASAPENLKQLARYQEIARRLARAEDLTGEQAKVLAAEGKAVVWIDGGLHATETVGTHQLIETVWQLASASDPEMLRILRDCIVLCVHANPDGQELVSNWYMREPKPELRTASIAPRLYQKYIGHDNNRDFFYSAMKETTNMNRQLFIEWFPQIVYNHHQTGPAGTVIFVPPFRDPFNYNYDPMVVVGVETLGNAIQSRFLQEGKFGATSRSGANYSTWFNGGLRTVSYFHNMIGLLTEIIGSPTPTRIPLIARRQLPSNDLTAPIAPQEWRYRQSIDYELAANRAVLDYASRHRDTLLLNIYRMGRNSIERGSRDSWTSRPGRIDEVQRQASAAGDGVLTEEPSETGEAPPATSPQRLALRYYQVLRKPEWRDPRGFIIPADQPDFPTAIKFLNSLVKTGVAIHRATAEFTVAGRTYPAGSFVVKAAQAFRPHVLDMFEPQDHPNDFKYDGGPPNKPYDVAGYTLAYQMGVKFDRVLEGFEGPLEKLPYGVLIAPPPGRISGAVTGGYLADHRANNSFILVNRLLKAGAEVFWLKEPAMEATAFGRGAIYVPDQPRTREIVEKAAAELGLDIRAVAARPGGEVLKLGPARIALWDRYGGSMPSGWTRWILEQFEFPFEVIYPSQIDAGRLREKYDAIIFPAGAIPAVGARVSGMPRPRNLTPEYEGRIGRLTPEKSIPALKEFLESGGTVVTLGSSTSLGHHLGLPIKSALTEKNTEGKERNLPDEKFYVPGSILDAKVDNASPLAWGMDERADVYFERSPSFTLGSDAAARGVKAIAWFDRDAPLRSGWAWGQKYLKDSVTVASAPVGSGTLCLIGTEAAFRGQTHGTYKFLFNALLLGAARSEK
ncbi:MAG: peptidase [Verrucomicrobia bacterium]|nr:peptidase [Verrucomicrobiota bacterium]